MDSIKEKVWEMGESILPDLIHYTLEVGYVGALGEEQELGYIILNNKTNVVEAMHSVFPEAVGMAIQLDAYYESFVTEKSGIVTPDKGLALPGHLKH